MRSTDHGLQCNEFCCGAVPWSLNASQKIFMAHGDTSLKPINPGMSRENLYESDPFPRACLSSCVMFCGLQMCAFLIVNFFHFYLLLLTQNCSLFLTIFLSISHVKCASPCLDSQIFGKQFPIFYCSYNPQFLYSAVT